MSGREEIEILVVGGGPAGATAALLLARSGIEVCLVERRREYQGKVCGEFVSAEGVAVLRRLGILERLLSRGALPITHTRIHSASGDAFDSTLPRSAGEGGIGISRRLLDEALLADAAAAGARIFRGARLSGLSRVASRWVARVHREGSTATLSARVVLGAGGRNSKVAELAGLAGTLPNVGMGLQNHFLRLSPSDERVNLFLLRGGYAGLAPVEQGRWCLGALLFRSAAANPFTDLTASLATTSGARAILASLGDRLDQGATHPIRIGMRRPTTTGLLLAGDAAGSVDPFSGQGIALALMGGEAAAESILGILRGRESPARLGYRDFLRREVGSRLMVTALLRRILERPGLAQACVSAFRRHPILASRLVGLTRNSGGPFLGPLPRLAARFLLK